jgi:hypothetical protein
MYALARRIATQALVVAVILTGMSNAASAQATQPRSNVANQVAASDPGPGQTAGYGPAPDWFKDPASPPLTPMPKTSPEKKGNKDTQRTSEVYLEQGYCRNVYGQYYWMSVGANPATCTQGYVKYYDSRNSSYLGAVDIYRLYWNMSPSTALVTAYNWCTNNFVCSALLGALVTKYIGAAWKLIRAIRWAL